HRAAAGHGPEGLDELVVAEHAVLEQAAHPARLVGEQLAGVEPLDVLGQDEHRQPAHLAPGGQRRLEPLVGEPRRQPHVHDRDVGPVGEQGPEQVRAGADGLGYLEAVRLQQPDQAVPQQEEVFSNNNAHGTSMTTMVGPPGGLFTARMPSNVPSRRSTPPSPLPFAGSAPPTPSSVTAMRRASPSCRMWISTVRACACLTTLASTSATAK